MREKPIRSIVKGITWRFLASLITIMASLFVTGEIGHALSIGGVDFLVKLVIYFIHERIWNKLKFGIVSEYPPDYQI